MNKTHVKRIKKWIAALRSGEYTQSRQRLCTIPHDLDEEPESITYCCLGVAGRVCHRISPLDMKGITIFSELKTQFEEYFGLHFTEQEINRRNNSEYDNYESYLIYLNDDKDYSFHKIASVIERDTKKILKRENKLHLWDEV